MPVQGMVNGIMAKTKGALIHGAIESLIPDVPLRSVPSHDGGCYTLAFDRCADRQVPGHLMAGKLAASRAPALQCNKGTCEIAGPLVRLRVN